MLAIVRVGSEENRSDYFALFIIFYCPVLEGLAVY
jgi:hypothetical protein